MALIFWDVWGTTLIDIVTEQLTINTEYYSSLPEEASKNKCQYSVFVTVYLNCHSCDGYSSETKVNCSPLFFIDLVFLTFMFGFLKCF